MAFGLVIEYNNRNIFFFKNYAKNEAWGLSSRPLLFSKKALYEIKASGLPLSFNISTTLNLAYNATKLYTTVEY